MVVSNWYDPSDHKRFEACADYSQVAPTDVVGLYDAHVQRSRERQVKLAHFRYIEGKLRKCYLYNGVHNFRQHCRHLMKEFQQTKDELMGWKESNRLNQGPKENDYIPDLPEYGLNPPQ